MERMSSPIRRGCSWTGSATMTPTTDCSTSVGGARVEREDGDRNSFHAWEKQTHSWVKAKPALVSSTTHAVRKTNLERSASLTEKELKEARTRSHIIATQLTVPAGISSRGVQLFNRRRQRVDAFTLVSVGAGKREGGEGGCGEPWSTREPTSPSTASPDGKSSGREESGHLKPRSSGARDPGESAGENADMEEVCEARHMEDGVHERRFLPVRQKDEETPQEVSSEHEEAVPRDAPGGNCTAPIPDQSGEEGAVLNRACECPVEALKAIPNGCHGAEVNGKVGKPGAKQLAITNRTARPFLSPTTVGLATSGCPASTGSPVTSYPASQGPSPHSQASISPFPVSSRPVYSPPPPAPSYPMPPLPAAMSPPPSFHSHAPPVSAVSPPPGPGHYTPTMAPRPAFIPHLLGERRESTPIRTGLLDEGRARRVTRKSMFTFQEKPKLSPNPELLSLVQGADEMRRTRGSQPEMQQEEELLALGAEASNFLAKDNSGVEEALVPEWASTLRSSRRRARVEHTPEQALTGASGRGAELFAQRQTRMERYIHEKAHGQRSVSPTQSLPPSWAYPSNMPGRVKAIVSSSNISTQISKTLQAQQATSKRSEPAKVVAPAPAPIPESPSMENGCSKVELELSRHQPYQLNSSLFILNPIKDPMSSLPRAAPPPRSVVSGLSYSRQTSLPSGSVPTQHAYRSAHCFSPPMLPVGKASSGLASPMPGLAPERVASPRSAVQTPKPTFSAKKAGITPQVMDEPPAVTPLSRSSTPTSWSPSRGERSLCAPWSPSIQHSSLATSPPPQTTLKTVTSSPTPKPFQSPLPSQPTTICTTTTPVSPPWDTKANHRLLAKNIINAAKRKNSPSPGAHSQPMSLLSSTPLPFEPKSTKPGQSRTLAVQSPTFTSPPATPTHMIRSPLRLYNTRSLTDSDASLESEDSGVRSPGLRGYNTCPRAWTGSLRVKRGVSEDL